MATGRATARTEELQTAVQKCAYLVFIALEEDDRTVELVDVFDGRAFVIQVEVLRLQRQQEAVEVTTLKLVRVRSEWLQVTDAIATGTYDIKPHTAAGVLHAYPCVDQI